MTAADFQFCDDFSTAMGDRTPLEAAAYAIADSFGLQMTFQFNRALQGATHALAGRVCGYPEDEFYVMGFLAASEGGAA